MQPMKKKKGEEERKMSQEEMLLEAAQTEIQNRQSLEIMLAREEEVKRRAIIHKEIYNGPQIRYISRNGTNIMEFTKVLAVPETIRAEAKPCMSLSYLFSSCLLNFFT
jgi:vacuolar protein sorting-associated protein 72